MDMDMWFLLGPPTADPFVQVEDANASYAWIHAYRDEQVFVTGLWEATKVCADGHGHGLMDMDMDMHIHIQTCLARSTRAHSQAHLDRRHIDERRVHAWVPGHQCAVRNSVEWF